MANLQDAPARGSFIGQVARSLSGQGQRLLDKNMAMCLDGLPGQRLVPDRRNRNDDGIAIPQECLVIIIALRAELGGNPRGAFEVDVIDSDELCAHGGGRLLGVVVSKNPGACHADFQCSHNRLALLPP